MIHNNLEILHLTKDLMIEIHKMTLLLSNIKVFGESTHISKSITSVSSLAAFREKKHYSYEFIKHLVTNHNGTQETDHLETLFEKGKLTHENLYAALRNKLERLGSMINGFKQSEENDNISTP